MRCTQCGESCKNYYNYILTMQKWIKSFGWAMHGLRMVWKEEVNFRTELYAAIILVALGGYLKFSTIEWVAVVAIITIVLAGEVVNTIIEDLCNKIEPRQDPVIGKIKDMAAGFVLLASLGAGIMGGLLILSHLFA